MVHLDTYTLDNVTPITSDKWHCSETDLKMAFMAISLPSIISGTKPTKDAALEEWNILNSRVMGLLYQRVDDQFKYIIEDCNIAKEAYKALKAEFVKPTMHVHVQAHQALYSIIYDPLHPISAFISAIEDAVKTLKDLCVTTISDDEQKDVLLFCLHESFSVVYTTIYSQSTKPSLDTVKTMLKGADSNTMFSDDL
jgi:hypothetical protein